MIESLDLLVGDYLAALHAGTTTRTVHFDYTGSWEPKVLHLSDLGMCPRTIQHRFRGDTEKPRTLVQIANRERLFYQAYMIHYTVYNALAFHDMLADHEFDVSEVLPEGWTGRPDCVVRTDNTFAPLDVKTQHPNFLAYKKDLPKSHNVLQVTGYHACCAKLGRWETLDDPWIYYTDRGGSNESVLCQPSVDYAELGRQMALLEEARDTAGLYAPLPKVTEKRGVKSPEVKLGPDWRCKYCDYQGAACPNDLEEVSLAYTVKGYYKVSKKGYEHADKLEKLFDLPVEDLDGADVSAT